MGAMRRIRTAAIMVALAGIFSLPAAGSEAQTVPLDKLTAQASQLPVAAEERAERRVRRPRLQVYPRYEVEPDGVSPRYYPGPNAVRECIATYAPEYRPSGTVIVPHMSCYWRRG
jgi:hypothetical protein